MKGFSSKTPSDSSRIPEGVTTIRSASPPSLSRGGMRLGARTRTLSADGSVLFPRYPSISFIGNCLYQVRGIIECTSKTVRAVALWVFSAALRATRLWGWA